MYDPDNPKIRDKGNGTAVHFERAYWQVMEQVEAPAESIRLLLPRLYDSYEAGASIQQMRYLVQYLPQGQWRWPEYERQLPDMRKCEYEGIRKHIETNNNLTSLAYMAGFGVFKKIARELLGDKMLPIRKWEQAQKLCEIISLQGYELKALELLRNAVLEKHVEKINDPDESDGNQDDMLQMLALRIHRIARGYERRHQIYEEEIFSYLILYASDRDKARPQCLAIEGKALHRSNPYWKDNFPPCERLDCRCRVTAKTEHGVQRNGLEIIDKI